MDYQTTFIRAMVYFRRESSAAIYQELGMRIMLMMDVDTFCKYIAAVYNPEPEVN